MKIYSIGKKLIRLGSNNDGGYIIADGLDYDCFISCGIGGSTSFENQFLSKYNIPAFGFDIRESFPIKGLKFEKKKIGKENNETTTNLMQILSKYKNVFLKMDIEGAEHEWLKHADISNVRQFVLEVHGIKNGTLSKLQEKHKLIHIHGNNYGGWDKFNGKIFPKVFECTLVRNEFYFKPSKIDKTLDQPNNKNAKDITISL